mgnify:CR=1 FL=1
MRVKWIVFAFLLLTVFESGAFAYLQGSFGKVRDSSLPDVHKSLQTTCTVPQHEFLKGIAFPAIVRLSFYKPHYVLSTDLYQTLGLSHGQAFEVLLYIPPWTFSQIRSAR